MSPILFQRIERFTCSVVCEIYFPPVEHNTFDTVVQIMRDKCLSRADLLGFCVITSGKNEVSHVLMFNSSGYPLVQFTHSDSTESVVFAKCSTALEHGVVQSFSLMCTMNSYFHLGGAFHGDTTAFDTSAFLHPFTQMTGMEGVTCRLTRCIVWAGTCSSFFKLVSMVEDSSSNSSNF